MIGFWRGLWLIASIELRQRVRGVAWYVLLGVFVLLLLIVTVLLGITFALTDSAAAEAGVADDSSSAGPAIFSTIIYFALLLGTLVAPALSGNAINGDRDSGTLATTQVTLITTAQLVLGKFLAAWLTALAFLGVAVPFLLVAQILGGVPGSTIGVSILVLAAELGIVSAIGVGLSGIIRRPLFSVVVTYLIVAALSVGTLIGFSLGGIVLQTRVNVPASSYDDGSGTCQVEAGYTMSAPGFDKVWWMLAANPYVVLADAVPTHFNGNEPDDLFGFIKVGVRSAQLPIDPASYSYDDCGTPRNNDRPTSRDIIDRTVPSWFVGLLLQLVVAAALLLGATRLTRAPSGRLAAGSRIA